MAEELRSYTSLGGSIRSQLREFRQLAKGIPKGNPAQAIEHTIAICAAAEDAYQQLTGNTLAGASALEIGPGTACSQMLYFGQKCQVVGIDLDVIATGWNPLNYLHILRTNGPKRFLKTIGRKIVAPERPFREAMRKRLGVSKLIQPRVLRMDASRMTFPDASFDFVYSFNVFEHIPDPRCVLRDIRRVLKPGGVVFTDLHLFTSDSGFHDLRVIAGLREGIPYWAHLRPDHRHMVQASSYVNKLHLAQWLEILDQELPGGSISYRRDQQNVGQLTALRKAGQLRDYSDDELLIHSILCAWKKPT